MSMSNTDAAGDPSSTTRTGESEEDERWVEMLLMVKDEQDD